VTADPIRPPEHGKYAGVWPVMLTPFDERHEIDWPSLERLIEWYLAAGVHGLFAACQSSEIFFLSDVESARLARFVVARVDGRVPVVASGHTAAATSQQAEQLERMAATGVDGVILISNRLATRTEPDERALENIAWLSDRVPRNVDLGIYECPYPYKRLLSDEVVRWCAASGRYTFIKDTSCNLDTLARRVRLAAGSRLRIANANSQTLLASLRAGCSGFSGVMANFHPELYVWLCEHWHDQTERAERLGLYLSAAALAETLDYPVCAKDFQLTRGNFRTANCRSVDPSRYYDAQLRNTVEQVVALGEAMKGMLGVTTERRRAAAAVRDKAPLSATAG
jgi:4-hydroxy-tetrahydrodipicolinate synthase